MKIEVGQWFRTQWNTIYKFNGTFDTDDEDIKCVWSTSGNLVSLVDIVKVADTPQELIQDKDLITFNQNPVDEEICESIVFEVDDWGKLYDDLEKEFSRVEVLKIFTPNSNGDYIKQWEAE